MLKKTPSNLFLLSTLFFAVFSTFASGAEKTLVESRWPEGAYAIRQETFISAIDTTDAKDVVGRSQTKAHFDWFIDAAKEENGLQRLTLKASRIMFRVEQDGQDLFYSDSENQLNGQEFEKTVYQHFFETPITVWLKNGKVERVEGCDALWKNIPDASDETSTRFLDNLKSIAAPESFGEIFDQLDYPLSPEPVAIGDSWTSPVSFELPLIGNKDVVWKCRWTSLAKKNGSQLAVVEAESELDLTKEANAIVKMSVEAKYDLDVKNVVEFSSRATVSTDRQTPVKDAFGNEKKTDVKTVVLIRNNLTVAKR